MVIAGRNVKQLAKIRVLQILVLHPRVMLRFSERQYLSQVLQEREEVAAELTLRRPRSILLRWMC